MSPSFAGWESAFYIYGGLAAVFSIIWYFTVSDSPHTNSRISEEELNYIEKGIPNSKDKVNNAVYFL